MLPIEAILFVKDWKYMWSALSFRDYRPYATAMQVRGISGTLACGLNLNSRVT
jgi:hypothetical protein